MPNQTKLGNTPRRQHHVWRAYLDAWATGEQIFCLRNGNVFQTNILNAAVERDFYKLRELTDMDIFMIRRMMKDIRPEAKQILENMIEMLALPSRFRSAIQEHVDDEVRAFMDQHIIMAEEELHGKIENELKPILDALRRKDISFYSDPAECGKFTHFICLQNLRTKGVQERIFAQAKEAYGMSLERSWNVLRHMMSLNAGLSLLLEHKKRPLKLLENETDIPFVTGDQPVVNLFGLGTGEPPRLLAFYYPISPRLAVILDEVSERTAYEAGAVSADQVMALNQRIRKASHEQVFSNSRALLEGWRQETLGSVLSIE